MSKNTRNTLRLAALVTSLAAALAIQPALAQDKPPVAAPAHAAHRDGHGDPAARLQKKLDDLGAKLHLKDNQQAAWKTYRGQVSELSAARHQRMEGGPEQRDQLRNAPAPERLQKAADRMREGAD